MFGGLKSLFRFGRLTEEDFRREQERILTKIPVPVFWLFGKTGSGKTSIVRYLTGAADAEIGLGFRPQTRFSRQYDFPDAAHPIARFLDTRGLGESRYDPAEDIAEFDRSAHMVLATARVMDHALAGVVDPLRAIRKAKPDRPIVLALTCLHEASPGAQHPDPDPFAHSLLPDGISESLRRSIERQRERFAGLADHIVPIDLTRTEEGFDEPEFGGERLKQTLLDVLPAAYRRTLRDFDEAMRPLKDLNERRATPYIIGYSSMAATAAAVPVPWVDIPIVMGIQSHMVYKLATLYGQEVRTSVVSQMVGAAGGRILARMAIRESLKFIPFVGSAANSAFAFVYTFAQGKVCCWYFGERCAGNAPSVKELEQVWKEQLAVATRLWQSHRGNGAVREPIAEDRGATDE